MKKTTGWLAAGLAVFALVWQQLQSVRLGYELERTRRHIQVQRERNAYLHMDLERRQSPVRLAALARERLGMHPPSPHAQVRLGDDASASPLSLRTPALLSRLFPQDASRP